MGEFSFNHEERAPVSGGKASSVIILLHGYGSSAAKAIEQAPWLQRAFPDAQVYAADGTYPYSPLMDPKSPEMGTDPVPGRFVWYHRYSEATRQEGLACTRDKLDAYINECAAANGLGRDRVALVGISQGAITVLNTVPALAEPVAASVAHSGYLFSPDSLASRHTQKPGFKASIKSKTPTCSIHGYLDFTLPWQSHIEAATAYDEAGIPVEFHLLAGLKHADFEPRSQAIAAEFIGRMLD